jgi:hypothetical protein
MLGIGRADWKTVMSNGSLAMGSFATINFTSITGLFEQAQHAETQRVLKEQFANAVATLSYGTKGLSSVFKVFRDGIIAENISPIVQDIEKKK